MSNVMKDRIIARQNKRIERLTADNALLQVAAKRADNIERHRDELQAKVEALEVALAIPKWRSCHKDNMEFSATISCYAMDKIRAATECEGL